MSLKSPYLEINGEIADINLEFLNLLTHTATSGVEDVLGLNAGIVTALHSLQNEQLEKISRAPLLLAEFSPFPGLCQIRDMPTQALAVTDQGWQQELKGFANRLLTCIWQTARHDRLMTSLFVGIDSERRRSLSGMSFCRLSRYSDLAANALQVRLADHPSFWPDMIRLVRNGSRNQRVVSRLSAIQLSVAKDWPESSRYRRMQYLSN
jgi:hypothetical protein